MDCLISESCRGCMVLGVVIMGLACLYLEVWSQIREYNRMNRKD